MAKPLSERVTSALANAAMRSADLQALISEGKAERDRLSGVMQQANDDALNLGLADDDRDAAAARADRARRDILALGKAIEELEARLTARLAVEQKQATAARRTDLLRERDEIAERLRAEWPDLEARMVELLSAVADNAAKMKAAGVYDADAEAVARDLPGNFSAGPIQYRQLTKIALPSFANGQVLAWPVPARPAKHWTQEVAENRQKQIELQRQQAAAAAASWALYSVSAGAIGRMTQVSGRAARRGPEAILTLYPENVSGAGRWDTSPRNIWLQPRDVEFLRDAGATVEPVTEALDEVAA